MPKYTSLAINDPADLLFGTAPHPLKTRQGINLGGGEVYPELNFTLPPITIEASTMPEIRGIYKDIITGALHRAAELQANGVVIEFETLPPMTYTPDWGVDLAKILLDGINDANAKHGLKSVLRMTPNDNREMVRPPEMRSGHYWEAMLETFERSAAAGAELLSIESVGGKEVHDEALTMCDLRAVIFALGILGCRDMEFLWSHIVRIAKKHGVHAAGDSACGFGNTAMVLSEQKLIPRVFAAVVRPITAVRALVAHEQGAVGPGKDCAYENPILKAITGFPMAMEGKTAACAHLSPVGNIAAAFADTWSNESVQHIKLLAGMAPTCYMEQLIYDTRLMNLALKDGKAAATQLRDWFIRSDQALDPQAYVLNAVNTIRFAKVIVAADSHYHACIAVAQEAITVLKEGFAKGEVKIEKREISYLDKMQKVIDGLAQDENEFIAEMMTEVDTSKFRPADYGIKV